MHIEAELDEIHGERLAQLQRRLQKPLPEVLATVIDWAIARPQPTLPEPMSLGEWRDDKLSREHLYGDDGR